MNPPRIPAYVRIADTISRQIVEKHLSPGERLPAEDALADTFHVSHMTVRQALQQLVQEGVVSRRQGLGTFVAEPKVARRSTRMTSFHEELVARGLRPASKVLQAEIRPAAPALQQRLSLAHDASLVYIERLRCVNGEPAALNWNYLRADLCAPLLEADLENRSLYGLLESHCHLTLGWVEQQVEARAARRDAARLLGLRTGTPLLYVERLTYLADDRMLGLTESLYRSDRYKLTSVLRR